MSAPSQSYPVQPQRPYWTVGKILGLFLGLIIIGGIAVFAVSQFRTASQSGALPIVQVTVSGSAQTVGFATTPVRVIFCGDYPGFNGNDCSPSGVCCPHPAAVSAGVSNGQYSLVLNNHSSWYVYLIYNTALQIQTFCYGGPVTINSLSGTYTYDVRC